MSRTLAISFTNFGPYHLARLRALAHGLRSQGGRLVAYEVAGQEVLYPWEREEGEEPFEWITLFPGRSVESVSNMECSRAMREALERDQPDVVAAVGYSRPESMAISRWATRHRRPSILMSESQSIDHPRVWWKEAVKRNRVRRFASALVGGPPHRDYLVDLGMPRDRVVLGYNAVDNARYADQARKAREDAAGRRGLPDRHYFLAVSRFAREKNLVRLVEAFARYRSAASEKHAWDLVLCGGGPCAEEIEAAIQNLGVAQWVHRPGFLQADSLARWYAFASAFVHPSLMEPWGLVANEAAACGLPLLISNRAGCGPTLVCEEEAHATGRRFNPSDVEEMSQCLAWMATLDDTERLAMGQRAEDLVTQWGPERFAQGTLDTIEIAFRSRNRSRFSWRCPIEKTTPN